MPRTIVLAYSGGLDTSIIVPWLIENYDAKVICVAADIGQGESELRGVREKAIASGAAECYVEDLREEFVRDFIFPTLRAGAIYNRKYLLDYLWKEWDGRHPPGRRMRDLKLYFVLEETLPDNRTADPEPLLLAFRSDVLEVPGRSENHAKAGESE